MERVERIEDGPQRRYSWLDRLVVCKDCRHVAPDLRRHQEHFKEGMHVNWLRNQAYREPKKRALWLKIWYNAIEAIEQETPWALAFDESEEIEEISVQM